MEYMYINTVVVHNYTLSQVRLTFNRVSAIENRKNNINHSLKINYFMLKKSIYSLFIDQLFLIHIKIN